MELKDFQRDGTQIFLCYSAPVPRYSPAFVGEFSLRGEAAHFEVRPAIPCLPRPLRPHVDIEGLDVCDATGWALSSSEGVMG